MNEPYIVVVDDLDGGFELVSWCTDEVDARKAYDSLKGEYLDKEGRAKRIFKEIEWSSNPNDSRRETE